MTDPLIRGDGSPYSNDDAASLTRALRPLNAEERRSYRDANAEAIATHGARRMLIVAGPGTGKSYLFIQRLKHWLAAHPGQQIIVATFVRKLAHDLEADIARDDVITPADKRRVEAMTIHHLARSIVERNHGTRQFQLEPHCRMIAGRTYEEMVWTDVFCLNPVEKADQYPWVSLRNALYDAEPAQEGEWPGLRRAHLELQRYYNALTFEDLILTATQAVAENQSLVADSLYIIDEFQDFNLAEEALIDLLTRDSSGMLVVGDDDQVLYDRLRRGHARIIRGYYQDERFVNAMLPFCIRCGFHICGAAEAFLTSEPSAESIPKVFLPFYDEEGSEKIKVVASTSPTTAVDFVESQLALHEAGIKQRQEDIDAGREKDPYVLILTPAWEMAYLAAGGAKDRLLEMLAPLTATREDFGEDYRRILDYYFAGKHPGENYTFRKVLHHDAVEQTTICALLEEVVPTGLPLARVDHEAVAGSLARCIRVIEVLDDETVPMGTKIDQLREVVTVADPQKLLADLVERPVGPMHGVDDEAPELDQARSMAAVQRTTIVGSKGLSADHVIVLGCDNVNLKYVSRSAFFVAMTRARKSLTLLAAIGGGGAEVLHEFVAALPNAHADSLYVKAGRVIEPQSSIDELQTRLEKRRYAIAQSAKRARKARPRRERG